MTTVTIPAVYSNRQIKPSKPIKKLPTRVFLTLEYDNNDDQVDDKMIQQ